MGDFLVTLLAVLAAFFIEVVIRAAVQTWVIPYRQRRKEKRAIKRMFNK